MLSKIKNRFGLIAATAAIAAATAGTASAQYTPPTLDEITFPIDTASIATAIGTAGAALLLLVFGWRVGFKFVNKLMRRLTSSV